MINADMIQGITNENLNSIQDTYWIDMVKWVKAAISKLESVKGSEVESLESFIVKTPEGIKNKTVYYLQNKSTKEWEEYSYLRTVKESEIPASIKSRLNSAGVDQAIPTSDDFYRTLFS